MGFIYVATDPRRFKERQWKIGMAENVLRRMEDYKTWSPDVYLCFCYEVTNPRLTENKVYKILEERGYRLEGEWFRAPSIDYLLRIVFNIINTYNIDDIPTLKLKQNQDGPLSQIIDDFTLSLDFDKSSFSIYQICDALYPGYYYHYERKEITFGIPRNYIASNSIKNLAISPELQTIGTIEYLVDEIKHMITKAQTVDDIYVDITDRPRFIKVTSGYDLDRFCLKRFRLYSLTRGKIHQMLNYLCPKLQDYLYCMKPLNLNVYSADRLLSGDLNIITEVFSELGVRINVSVYPYSSISIFIGDEHIMHITPDIHIYREYEFRQYPEARQIKNIYNGIRDCLHRFCLNNTDKSSGTYKRVKADALKKLCIYFDVKYTKASDNRVFCDIVAKHGLYKPCLD